MKKFLLLFLMGISVATLSQAQPLLEVDGTPDVLTPEDEYFIRPAWSPDGEFLAFTTRNHFGIWIMDLDTRKITKLVDKEGAGYRFAWSPDGAFVGYRTRISENKRTQFALEIINISTNEIQLLRGPEKLLGAPRWGRDNSRLFFTSNQKLVQLETGLTNSERFTKPIPASERFVAFTRFQKLQIAPLKDTLHKKIRLPKESIINPVLSPDGDRIVYEEVAGDLIVMNLLTGKKESLGSGHRAVWSPDGDWISYMLTEDDGHQYLVSEIYLATPDGKQMINLSKTEDQLEMNPAWSPDGESIAYDERRSGAILLQKLRVQ